jgi:hypothetical protein
MGIELFPKVRSTEEKLAEQGVIYADFGSGEQFVVDRNRRSHSMHSIASNMASLDAYSYA